MGKRKNPDKSALSIQHGVRQRSSVSEDALKRYKEKKKKQYSADEFVDGILAHNRVILSQAITLVESLLPGHSELARQVIERCLPYAGNSIRVGITGIPGVGKSTFIELLGKRLTGRNHHLAVLAIDPSSEKSKGSILGDKTRMEELSADPNAFIRPSPSAGTLGGVARKTREAILLCEAAGFDVIFVETVGVGQSETAVHSMVDFFLLLMLPGAGDELQGMKRGIIEMADAIAITKCDGTNIRKAERAKNDFSAALHLYPAPESGWLPMVFTCSSVSGSGIEEIWQAVLDYKKTCTENSYFKNNRTKQSLYWMYESINQSLKDRFYHTEAVSRLLPELEKEVLNDRISSFAAAGKILSLFPQS